MRHLIGLSGCLLALSCSLNSDNLTTPPDAGGTGGAAACPRCVPAGATGGSGSATGAGGTTLGSGGLFGSGGALGTGGMVTGAGGALGSGGVLGSGGKKGNGSGGTLGIGGTLGTGGDKGNTDGGESCDQLESDYANALPAARDCTPVAQNQCQQLVDSSLSCPGCKQYVNDTTTLDAIAAAWNTAGCGGTLHICPAIACALPGQLTCTPTGSNSGPGAGGSCVGHPTTN